MMHQTQPSVDLDEETNNTADTVASNQTSTPTANKPKPLHVDETSSNETIEPTTHQPINQEGAQSPLYYVPSAILYTPHGSHAPHISQAMNQTISPALNHPRYAPSPVALGSYPRYSAAHHQSQLAAAALNQSINQSNGMLFALNFPSRSSSDAAIEAMMAANLLGSPTHRSEPYPNYLNQTMNQQHQSMVYTGFQGSPVSPMNFSPLTSPISPALSSVFGLPSPTGANQSMNQSLAHSMGFTFDTSHQPQSAFTFTDMNGGRPHDVNQYNDFSQSLNQNPSFSPAAMGYPVDHQWLGFQQQQQHNAFGMNRQPSDFDAFGQPINHGFDPTRLNDKVPYSPGPRQHQQNNYNNLAGSINHPSHPLYGRLNEDPSANNKRSYRGNHRQNNYYQPGLSTVPAGNSGSSPASRQNNAHSPDQLVASLTVETVAGQVVRLAKTHSGSRLMQHKLESKDTAFFPVLFRELKGSIVELACDNFAHFAVEKLIAASNEEQVNELLEALAPAFNSVACQKHGSFACQAMVDACTTTTQQKVLSEAIQGGATGEISLLQLCLHASGHFVVLRMLEKLDSSSSALDCIDKCMCDNAAAIAADHHGLRVVKAYIAARPKEKVQPFYTAIIEHTLSLASTAFGNYTIQACLEVADASTRARVRTALRGHYAALSKQKFSSNVVEHCLKHAGGDWKRVILGELCAQPGVSELLRDRYGNYVLQSAVTVASGGQLQYVIDSITPHLSSLRENVRQKWKSIIIKAQAQLASNEPEPIIQVTRTPSPVPGLPPIDMPSKVQEVSIPPTAQSPGSPIDDEVGPLANVVRALRIEAA